VRSSISAKTEMVRRCAPVMPFVSSRGRALKPSTYFNCALHCVLSCVWTLRHPGWEDGEVEWEPLPVNEAPSRPAGNCLAR